MYSQACIRKSFFLVAWFSGSAVELLYIFVLGRICTIVLACLASEKEKDDTIDW